MQCVCCCPGCFCAICMPGTFLRLTAGARRRGAVEVDTGARVPYDYLVLASGSSYPCPEIKAARGSLAERKQAYAVRLSPPSPFPSPSPLPCEHLSSSPPPLCYSAML